MCEAQKQNTSHGRQHERKRVHVNNVLNHVSNIIEKNINADHYWKQVFKSK